MKLRFLSMAVALILLSGCTSDASKSSELSTSTKFSTLTDLKLAFENAGGQCWDWEEVSIVDFKDRIGQGECDSKTVLILYKDNLDTRENAIKFRKFLVDLKFNVNLLFGENWMINSDQVSTVYPKMGGTLMTR